ncbi:LysR family transcriptional regulator [Phenylobacterium sp.]|jgi:DNA-binding transcriptional LysR family regulator|uniref:LysR family transcriptional regulator n=1 Tax=Phenylobacterium sp. TaxID=1871053 RepID=UPI002E343336|nr:LysR family transcriptional regulator [Phenylobacterium sp.]HEX2560778.1 LysR family transcriptional regulator [Phenylobacterium sp.]
MNFAAFDLNLLRVFDALARERSVTRAGEQVGLSQPAVSSALNRLRAILDDQLFVRRGAEMAPTPRAEALAPAVREALASLERALAGDARFDPAKAQRTFTLLGADFFSTLVIPRLHERIAAEAPGVRLRLLDTAFGDVERLLAADVLDLALERPLQLPEWVATQALFLSPFVLVAANDHPQIAAAGIAPGEVLPLDLFCALPHAIRSVDGSLSGMVDEVLEASGRRREVVLGLPHFFAVARAVAAGHVIAALPRQFADAFAKQLGLAIYALPVPSPAPEIRMYWHSRHQKNPAHVWLREVVVEVIAELEPGGR